MLATSHTTNDLQIIASQKLNYNCLPICSQCPNGRSSQLPIWVLQREIIYAYCTMFELDAWPKLVINAFGALPSASTCLRHQAAASASPPAHRELYILQLFLKCQDCHTGSRKKPLVSVRTASFSHREPEKAVCKRQSTGVGMITLRCLNLNNWQNKCLT